MNDRTIWYFLIYVSEAAVMWQYVEYLFPRKHGAGRSVLQLAVTYFILFLIVLQGNTEANIISFFLLNFLLLLLTWQMTWKAALLHSALMSFLMSASEVIYAFILTFFGFEFDAYATNDGVFLSMSAVSTLVYYMLSVLTARVIRPHQYGKRESGVMALFCVLPLMSVGVATVVVFVGNNAQWDHATSLVIAGCTLSLLLANMAFAVLYNHLQKGHALEEELRLSMQKAQMDAEHFQRLHEMSEDRRSLLHDINHHFRTIALLAQEQQNGKIVDYIEKLDHDARFASEAPICNHPVLNMLLMRAREECQQKGITLTLNIREGGAWYMDPTDTTTLMGNLISNAIEAAEKSAEKCFSLSVQYDREKDMFVLTAVNSCDTPPKSNGRGGFLSSKSDRQLHGIGMKNIQRVAERYHGVSMAYYEAAEKEFHYVIQFVKE